jgi:hypothetical protein
MFFSQTAQINAACVNKCVFFKLKCRYQIFLGLGLMDTIRNSMCIDGVRSLAKKVLNDEITPLQLRAAFDDISLSRNVFEEWLGDSSAEFQLTNALMVLSRVIRNPADSCNAKISEWIEKNALFQEWYDVIQRYAD